MTDDWSVVSGARRYGRFGVAVSSSGLLFCVAEIVTPQGYWITLTERYGTMVAAETAAEVMNRG
jgi:hypothetical protein